MKRIEKVYEIVSKICMKEYKETGEIRGLSASEIADILGLQRTNVSSDLNKLFKDGRIEKLKGKPVLYKVNNLNFLIEEEKDNVIKDDKDIFSKIIGENQSLKNAVQQAKAAIIYPPNGLHTLLYGETGTGKSMFAEIMYKYAKEIGKIGKDAPFAAFNCADYANNPQLLMAQLFGVKKGAYTGAEEEKIGVVGKANKGVLFLDEIHRLPPEGQEMLFYLIDKGIYRKLGEPNADYHSKLLIICATTENINSTLLRTFIRRIPMIIQFPPLKDRTIEERYQLIERFFKSEAACIKKDISVTANSMKALLLYDCPNNIGQLKSDIKLCCAKAFLQSKTDKDNKICVHSEDLPGYVLRGALKYKENKDEIDKLIKNKSVISFTVDQTNSLYNNGDMKIYNFYEALEEKRNTLKSKGLSENDIDIVMSLDVDTYLKRYILNTENKNLEALYKVVDKRIVDIVEKFLKEAEERLHREFNSKIFHALSMHLASSIERINSGKKIENNQLEDIRKHHKLEYDVAIGLKNDLKANLDINLPDDEIGFIAMFLYMDQKEDDSEGRVAVLVAMHGESAATSIADVANRLLEEKHAVGYNMTLDEKPEKALENIMGVVKEINEGKGIIFLVDMGSLVFFGDMIYEKTKIPVRTVEMVSTPIVLEATRKALLNSSLEEVYDSCIKLSPFTGRIYRDSIKFSNKLKNDVILTACITGKGTAIKLKNILEQKINASGYDIDIIPVEVSDNVIFKNNIQKIKQKKNILAVIGPLDPKEEDMIYFSIADTFNEDKLTLLENSFEILKVINNMKDVVDKTIDIDAYMYIEGFKKFYIRLFNSGVPITENVVLGLILHIGCAVERVLNENETIHTKNKEAMIKHHINEFKIIKNAVIPIESLFNITFLDEEYVNIMKIVYQL
ncbi:sigma 54-interacting transcriptional regulator [Paratissierella segnis]|uniref:Sigma 54-interacting transcriptional regulator n=1 Tax=Paratissierella segnis TaxID=2763679 RepID=A0A926EQE2_9FIRM|nr:sigma-54-dependent transcriptional regulator [Paratissierella segnis]MBC8586871.1 sigma 54-interacting transcriptional regulator [Paratissierella segnis]